MHSAKTKMPELLKQFGLQLGDQVKITREKVRGGGVKTKTSTAFLGEGRISHISNQIVVVQGRHYREAFSTNDLFSYISFEKK